MKAYINDNKKRVYVDPDGCDPDDLLFMGFRLGTEYADLVIKEGWGIYVKVPMPIRLGPDLWREITIQGAHSLADAIRQGPPCTHSCPRHPKREAAG